MTTTATPSTEITIKGTIYTRICEWSDQREYHFSPWDMGGGWAKLQEHTIQIPAQATEEDMVLAEVQELRKGIQNVKQAAFEKVAELEEKIAKLSAIGYTAPLTTTQED